MGIGMAISHGFLFRALVAGVYIKSLCYFKRKDYSEHSSDVILMTKADLTIICSPTNKN